MTMVRTAALEVRALRGLRPQLFDLERDPDELDDLGADPAHAAVREQMAARLFDWLRQRKRTTTITHEDIELWNRREIDAGIRIGEW